MKKLIILNGPSQAGKDEIATFIADYVINTHEEDGVMLAALATPAKEHAISVMMMNGAKSAEDVLEYFESHKKNEPWPYLNGMSVREHVIDYCENFMKPSFGEDIFGRSVKNDIIMSGYPEYVVVTDLGFTAELDQLVELRKEYEIYLVSVTRPGKTWNESRSDMIEYAASLGLPVHMTIENDAGLGELKQEVDNIMERIG